MATILDSLFHKVFNTISTPIWGAGWGVVGSHKVVDSSNSKNYMAKWHQFRLFSAPHITKCSYINTQSHQLVLWWFPAWLSAWPGKLEIFTDHSSTCGHQIALHEWGFSKSRLLNLWQWYKHELLVYCCIDLCGQVIKIPNSPETLLHFLLMIILSMWCLH